MATETGPLSHASIGSTRVSYSTTDAIRARRAERVASKFQRQGVRDLYKTLGRLETSLVKIEEMIDGAGIGGERLATARGSRLGLSGAEQATALSSVAEFSSVVSGTFEVNGVTITVDPSVDSLEDVVDALNSSGAGVEAGVSSAGGLYIRADTPGESFTLESDTTGLLSDAGISETEYLGGRRGASRSVAGELTEIIEEMAEELNTVFLRVASEDYAADDLAGARKMVRTAITSSFDAGVPDYDTDMGLIFNVEDVDDDQTELMLDLSAADRSKLKRSVIKSTRRMVSFLIGDSNDPGLIPRMRDATKRGQHLLAVRHPDAGLLVDKTA